MRSISGSKFTKILAKNNKTTTSNNIPGKAMKQRLFGVPPVPIFYSDKQEKSDLKSTELRLHTQQPTTAAVPVRRKTVRKNEKPLSLLTILKNPIQEKTKYITSFGSE